MLSECAPSALAGKPAERTSGWGREARWMHNQFDALNSFGLVIPVLFTDCGTIHNANNMAIVTGLRGIVRIRGQCVQPIGWTACAFAALCSSSSKEPAPGEILNNAAPPSPPAALAPTKT